MGNVPDAKTVEVLNAITKGRSTRGKWKLVATSAAIVLVLLAGAAAAVESHRQAELRDARVELVAELDEVVADHADIEDLDDWYRSRMPENWGGVEFRAWLDRLDVVRAKYPEASDWAEAFREQQGVRPYPTSCYSVPAADELDAFLADTDPLIADARLMLRFDCITPLPPVKDGVPYVDVIAFLGQMRLLDARIWVHAARDDWGRAWDEFRTRHELGVRLTSQTLATGEMLSAGLLGYWLEDGPLLLGLHCPERPVLEMLATLQRRPATRIEHIVQGERLWFSRVYAKHNSYEKYEATVLEDECGSGRLFSYLDPSLTWKQRRSHLMDGDDVIRENAKSLSDMRRVATGESIRFEALSPLSRWIETVQFRNVEYDVAADTLELLARIRLAELDHADVDSVVMRLAAHYPRLEVQGDDRQWVVQLCHRYASSEPLFRQLYDDDLLGQLYGSTTLPRLRR